MQPGWKANGLTSIWMQTNDWARSPTFTFDKLDKVNETISLRLRSLLNLKEGDPCILLWTPNHPTTPYSLKIACIEEEKRLQVEQEVLGWRRFYTARAILGALDQLSCQSNACSDFVFESKGQWRVLEDLWTPKGQLGINFERLRFEFTPFALRPCIGSADPALICLDEVINLFFRSNEIGISERPKVFLERYFQPPSDAPGGTRSALDQVIESWRYRKCGFDRITSRNFVPETLNWNECDNSHRLIKKLYNLVDPFGDILTKEIVDNWFAKYRSCKVGCQRIAIISRQVSSSYDLSNSQRNMFLIMTRLRCDSAACLTAVDEQLQRILIPPAPPRLAIDRVYLILGLLISAILLVVGLAVGAVAWLRWGVLWQKADVFAIYIGTLCLIVGLVAIWARFVVSNLIAESSVQVAVLLLQGLIILVCITVLGVRFLFAAASLFHSQIGARAETIIWRTTIALLVFLSIAASVTAIVVSVHIHQWQSRDYANLTVVERLAIGNFLSKATQALGLGLPSLALLGLLATFVLSLVTLFKVRRRPQKEWRNKREDMRALVITSAILSVLFILVALKLSVNALALLDTAHTVPQWYSVGLVLVGVDSAIAGVFLLFAFLAFRASHISKQKREEMIELHGHKTPLLEGEIPEQYDV